MKSLALILFLAAAADAQTLRVGAGAHDRLQTVVKVPIPENARRHPVLVGKDGVPIPLQLSDDGTAAFILPDLAAGETAEFTLANMKGDRPDHAVAKGKDGGIAFLAHGKPVGTFIGPVGELPRADIARIYLRGGYLHPLLTPTGIAVTDDYPANHLHHHGVWSAWTKAVLQGRETDFWNMGQGKGRVDCKGIGFSWGGPVHAGVEAENLFTDLTSGEPVAALSERWTVRAYAVRDPKHPYNLMELASEQEMAGDGDLGLPEYHYGGFGIRGRGEWDGARNAQFLTSAGIADRNKANGKPARWIAMAGNTGEGRAGIAILGHPGNFRAPQPLRVHPTEPFLCFAPQIAGAMKLSHGETYRSGYRLVLFDGAPERELLDRLWNDYASPPTATWD